MLGLLSDSDSFTSAGGLVCRFTNENIGLRLRMGGVELSGVGEDGGLDRSASSENTAAASLGVEGSAELSRAGELSCGIGTDSTSSAPSIAFVSSRDVDSTRLRFAGGSSGSSLYNEGFRWRE